MKPKLLVVDDSKMMHKMYEVMLREYPIVYATDGRIALDRLAEHQDIQVMLLDLNMPTMNGLELLERLDRDNGPRILIIAKQGEEADVARAIELGAHATITLPFQAEQLNDAIAQLT